MPPSVSIVLPTYNRLDYLKEAVDSVRAQTMNDWELIIVDDGSTDETIPWISSLGDPRIRLVPIAHTGHIGHLRNIGMTHVRGEWIAVLDSDDRWMPEKLERQLALHLGNPRVRWSYTGRTIIDAKGRVIPDEKFKPWEAHSGRILKEVLTLEANIPGPSVMIEHSLMREFGGFDEGLRRAAEYELWLRLAEQHEVGVVPEPLVEVRTHHSTTFGLPDVNIGHAGMYRRFARRTTDPTLRQYARHREALHSVYAANTLMSLHRWGEAAAQIGAALRVQPTAPFVYRALARLGLRRVKVMLQGATKPEAFEPPSA